MLWLLRRELILRPFASTDRRGVILAERELMLEDVIMSRCMFVGRCECAWQHRGTKTWSELEDYIVLAAYDRQEAHRCGPSKETRAASQTKNHFPSPL